MDENKNIKLLQTVEDVFTKKYTIPDYQRGYKWTAETVTQLLDDINNFIPNPNEENFYCLQNITVIKGENDYEVIDGQQRLTTLAILLAYLGEGEGLVEKLNYAIREESGKFLREYVLKAQEAHNFYDAKRNAFIEGSLPDKKYDRQDIFHFAQAAHTIDNWFKGKSKEDFVKKLKHVKLIFNEVEGKGVENRIFSNLNANKVPLTPVDLIRAILITRSTSPAEGLVTLNEQRVRLGWELDLFQQWWHGDTSFLFSQFLKAGEGEESKDLKAMDGIEVLYRLCFNKCTNTKENDVPWLSIKGIQQKLEQDTNISSSYQDLRYFHHVMQDWFEDRAIYHYLGFLAVHGGLTIRDLWQKWHYEITSRSAFVLYLKDQIRESLFKTLKDENKPKDLSPQEKLKYICTFLDHDDNLYGGQKDFLHAVLVLMDIIGLTSKKEEREVRRLPVSFFRNNSEDIEHIFCQTPNSKDLKNFQKEVLEDFKTSLCNLYKEDGKLTKKIDEFKGSTIEEYEALLTFLPGFNSVGNLLLLNSSTNRSYGNDEYLKKRERIIKEHQEGTYIRPHTLTVFTKSFAQSKDLNTWGLEDIKNNASYIKEAVQNFLKEPSNG